MRVYPRPTSGYDNVRSHRRDNRFDCDCEASYDAPYERGFVSDYYAARRGYHVMRRKGTLTSYLVYSVSGLGFVRDPHNRVLRVQRGDLVLIEPQTYQEYGVWRESSHWNCHWVHFDAEPHWTHWLPCLRAPLERRELRAHQLASGAAQVSDLFFELQNQRTRPEIWRHALALNLLERILILARSNDGASRPVDLVSCACCGPSKPALRIHRAQRS
jgi:hypothetical protein